MDFGRQLGSWPPLLYLDQLVRLVFKKRNRFPDYSLNILAHSQGGAIASEALSEGAPFDTLILSQVAMPSSCYDINAPTNADLVAREMPGFITPDWQPMGYHGAHTNTTGRIINYFDVDDKLLDLWLKDQKAKPSTDYSYDGTNCYYNYWVSNYRTNYVITDSQEARAQIARSRTLGIGALGSTAGVVQSAIDLKAQFKIGSSTDEHSAFFTRPIQTILPYYNQILLQIQPTP